MHGFGPVAMRLLDFDHVGQVFPCRQVRTDLVEARQVVDEGGVPMKASDWNPEAYVGSSAAQESWGEELHGKLNLRGDESIVDIGSGDGRLTARLVQRLPHGRVVGLDASQAMVEHARSTWGDVPGLEFRQADASSFLLDFPVDVLVSNAVLHWIPDLEPVFACARQALKPGGRIMFQMGGIGNIARLVDAAKDVLDRNQWWEYFPAGMPQVRTMHTVEEAWQGMETAGLDGLRVELLERDMVHANPEAMLAWMRSTWFSVVEPAPETVREQLLTEIRDAYLADWPPDVQGRTHVGMVRLEVEAIAPM
jgi:trans-aconitate methyltransferase